MASLFQFPFVFGVPVLPASRVIGVDAGSRCVKVVLAEKFLGRVRVLRRDCLELTAADSVSLAERLAGLIADYGQYPVAINLPQHLTISQVVDLPPVPQEAVERLVQNEAYKLAGLGQSKVAIDHARLEPYGHHANPYWITLCQEQEIGSVIQHLGLEPEDVCGATSTGNALIAAYLAQFPETEATVLVDLGLRSTTVAILHEGQGVHVTSFALGAELFLEAIATARRCDFASAESLWRERLLLEGAERVAGLGETVDHWRRELVRLVQEWTAEHANLRLNPSDFQFVLAGGGTAVPGLVLYLNRSSGLPVFGPWPRLRDEEEEMPGRHAVAEGTARQALRAGQQSACLLAQDLRVRWRRQRAAQIVQSVTFGLLLAATVLLGLGTWQKATEGARKRELHRQAEEARLYARQIEEASRRLTGDFDRLRPLLERQQFTLDLLQSMALLQQARSNRSYWYVLFADQQSYFSAPTADTNSVAATNVPPVIGPLPPADFQPAPATNRPPALRAGFIAELCIPEEGEAMRRTLSQVVAALKQHPRYRNVDSVPPEQRRPLAEPKALLPERHFALFLELATNEFLVLPEPATNAPSASPAAPARAGIKNPEALP